jgi:hypothetical protein
MVRNPDKLLGLLSISEAPSNLTIITGAIQDGTAMRRSLLTSEGRLVDIVVSCIGFVPSLKPTSKGSINPFKNIDDLHICEQGTKNILSAISDIKSEQQSIPPAVANESGHKDDKSKPSNPLVVVLSTTGISSAGRDIPILMAPLYHGLLGPPHKDKRAMEDVLHSSFQPWIVIRPAFLVGDGTGEPTGKKIRVGIEKDGKHEKLAIGYTIKREDVGYWIFKEIVQGDWMRWVGRAVTLTH